MIRASRSVALAASALLLVSGCESQPKLLPPWPSPELPTARITPLALAVGVHYSEDFRRKQHPDINAPFAYRHQPGSASVELFDNVLDASFEKVVRIPQWSPGKSFDADVAFVFVPAITGVWGSGNYGIRYEIDIFAGDGAPIDTLSIYASGAAALTATSDMRAAEALRIAASDLLMSLRERPEIRARASERSTRPPRIPGHTQARNAAIALIGEPNWVQCMRHALGDGNPPVLDVEPQHFRDAMFPWFEPSVPQPATAEGWAQRLSEPMIRAAADEVGARYVLFISGNTTTGVMQGLGWCSLMGCVGGGAGERHSSLNISLIDFARGELLGENRASESGRVIYVVYAMPLPIPIASPTETQACQKIATEVRQLLSDR